MVWLTGGLAVYGAGLSTLTAFRWFMEARPYLTVFQPKDLRSADNVTIRVHNPGRKMVFIVPPGRMKVRKANGTEELLKLTPRGEDVGGVSPDYMARLITGRWQLGIAPGGSADFNIGPMYNGLDVLFMLEWHRGEGRKRRLPFWLESRFNPLKVPVTPEIEELIGKGRIDFRLQQ